MLVHRPGPGVRSVHLEVETVDTLSGERVDHGADERGCDAGPPRLRHDVQIGQPAESRGGEPPQREADRAVILLRDEGEPGLDDLPDLLELAGLVVSDVRRWRYLARECPPLLLEERQVGSGGGADVHGA